MEHKGRDAWCGQRPDPKAAEAFPLASIASKPSQGMSTGANGSEP